MGFKKTADIPKEEAKVLTEVEAIEADLAHLEKTGRRLTSAEMREEPDAPRE